MMPQLTGTKRSTSVSKPSVAEVALSLQEELAAAIQGAFEVAVEIAVREVTKLVSQATREHYEDIRRENEGLKQKLQRAEAMLDCVRQEERRGGRSPPRAKQHLDAPNHTSPPPHAKCSQKSSDSRAVHGLPGAKSTAVVRTDRSPDPQQKHRHQARRLGHEVKTQHVSDATSDSKRNNGWADEDALSTDDGQEMSQMRAEKQNQKHRDLASPDQNSPLRLSEEDKLFSEQVSVKQEKSGEVTDGSACCLDSIKVEDLSPECILAVESQMLEEWKPEVLDIPSQDPITDQFCTGPALDLPSLSSDFPNILQRAEPAPVPEASPQVHGVHVRTNRNVGHAYTCKHCGQVFHLPSLLRRHYGQCQQKLQQFCQQPVMGSRRARLQLYPPGCSPFRCTVCSREFNRMENLKTHLRIHTGERPYTCSVCSKCFRHSGALTRHFRIHTGEKPYICGQCGKSFRNCGGLKFHQRSHIKQLQ